MFFINNAKSQRMVAGDAFAPWRVVGWASALEEVCAVFRLWKVQAMEHNMHQTSLIVLCLHLRRPVACAGLLEE